MSMLEKMARQLATDALERVKPGTYTSVVDGVGLYQMLDGNYQVGERLGAGDEDAPGISYDAAREMMVAMMAAQAGAIVVVPEDAPEYSHMAQIAALLKQAGDPTVTDLDVSDADRIVETVARMLRVKDSTATELSRLRGELREALAKVQHSNADSAAESNHAVNLQAALDLARKKLIEANKEIGTLTAKLEDAKRRLQRSVDEAANREARYEGMQEALRMTLEMAGVGK